MIRIIEGNMMQSEAEALVNTVNTVGVMGKGIALQFKQAFPSNHKQYAAACKSQALQVGQLLAIWDQNLELGRKLIINFPTKIHWRNPSKYEYIENGLVALRALLISENIKSIAIPPLGCGLGGLDWHKVKPMIETALQDLDTEIMIYAPNNSIKNILQQKEVKKEVKLSPARAALLYVLFAFESLGEYSSLFSANKLAYFLQRNGQNLKLDFKAHHYGPYAMGVEKVLYHLNGVYLKGMEQGSTKPFESLKLNYEKWDEIKNYVENDLPLADAQRVKNVIQFLSAFTSELSLEILASVDFIMLENPTYTIDDVMTKIAQWNPRKQQLFKQEYVQIAYDHLKNNLLA
jgi:O-acetyl-ADP-ribose deacetylase (regulator of RNase III)